MGRKRAFNGWVIIREHSGFGHGENSRAIDMIKLANIERAYIRVRRGVQYIRVQLACSYSRAPEASFIPKDPATSYSCPATLFPKHRVSTGSSQPSSHVTQVCVPKYDGVGVHKGE